MNVLQNCQYRRVSLISKRWLNVRSWLRRPVNEKEKEIMREKVLKGESIEDKASVREKVIKGDGSGHDDPLEGPGVTLLASVCFLFPLGCFYYGTVNSRKRWEAEVVEHLLKRKMEAPPVPLPEELNHVHDMEFRHVQVKIGFKVYRVDDRTEELSTQFFSYRRNDGSHKCVAKTATWQDGRETNIRLRMPVGKYCIIPSTFLPDQEGDFILRVHIERYSREEQQKPLMNESSQG